ncbi:MAG: D-aminoacyl-tRNA deacylase [Planctomycetota bacterium]
MRAVVQRVDNASVQVEGRAVSEIGRGFLILVSVAQDDCDDDARSLAEKCAHLRVIEDEESKFNRSLLDDGGEALVVSQFTLHGDARKGRRPSFTDAAPPDKAETLYRSFCAHLCALGVPTKEGVFAASMNVALTNRGPVTILLDTKKVF